MNSCRDSYCVYIITVNQSDIYFIQNSSSWSHQASNAANLASGWSTKNSDFKTSATLPKSNFDNKSSAPNSSPLRNNISQVFTPLFTFHMDLKQIRFAPSRVNNLTMFLFVPITNLFCYMTKLHDFKYTSCDDQLAAMGLQSWKIEANAGESHRYLS